MLTQFFGNYLLEKHVVDSKQLLEALRYKHNNYETLDAIALSSGYMTKEESEDVHNMQTQMDGDFVELAFHMGYLTEEQAKELAEIVHYGYLLLGNAIIELGYCTQEDMARIVADYEFDFQLSFSSFLNFDKEKIDDMVMTFYHIPDTQEFNPQREYITLLVKNILRFIGDDFRFSPALTTLPNIPDMREVRQNILGSFHISTYIIGYKDFMDSFASRYACESLTEKEEEEYVTAALEDFLNLNNGIFTVNMSNDYNEELELSAPEFLDTISEDTRMKQMYIIPIEFSFGTIYFCFSKN